MASFPKLQELKDVPRGQLQQAWAEGSWSWSRPRDGRKHSWFRGQLQARVGCAVRSGHPQCLVSLARKKFHCSGVRPQPAVPAHGCPCLSTPSRRLRMAPVRPITPQGPDKGIWPRCCIHRRPVLPPPGALLSSSLLTGFLCRAASLHPGPLLPWVPPHQPSSHPSNPFQTPQSILFPLLPHSVESSPASGGPWGKNLIQPLPCVFPDPSLTSGLE